MCLAIPGKINCINCDEPLARTGIVSFGGVLKQVNLSFVPEAQVGDYVLTHVGFAISRVDQAEADRVFQYLEQIGELKQLDDGGEPAAREDGEQPGLTD